MPPPVQGRRDRPRGAAVLRAHRRRDPVHPAQDHPRPGAVGCTDGDPAMITVTIWHNVARDGEGRPTGMLAGYQHGDQVVRVFTYQADPAGRDPEQIAEEAFAISATATPATPAARTCPAAITSAGCGRCRSPETGRVAAGRVALTVAPCGPDRRGGRRANGRPASVSQVQGGRTDDGQDLAAAGPTARPSRKVRRGRGGGCDPVPGGRIHLPPAARDRGQARWRAPDVLSPRSGPQPC